MKWEKGQATMEYVLATAMFLVIFSYLYQVTQSALKNLFTKAAFIVLSAYK